jgi:hypothetical protein
MVNQFQNSVSFEIGFGKTGFTGSSLNLRKLLKIEVFKSA